MVGKYGRAGWAYDEHDGRVAVPLYAAPQRRPPLAYVLVVVGPGSNCLLLS